MYMTYTKYVYIAGVAEPPARSPEMGRLMIHRRTSPTFCVCGMACDRETPDLDRGQSE